MPDSFRYVLQMPAGEAQLNQAAYRPMVEALAERPHSIAELLARRGPDGGSASPGEVAMVLAGTYQALVASDPDAPPSARNHRFHLAMARRDARPDNLNAPSAMASPRLGTGYPARAAETLVAARIGSTGAVPDPVAFAAEMLPPGPERDTLAQTIETVLRDRLAVWRGLGIV